MSITAPERPWLWEINATFSKNVSHQPARYLLLNKHIHTQIHSHMSWPRYRDWNKMCLYSMFRVSDKVVKYIVGVMLILELYGLWHIRWTTCRVFSFSETNNTANTHTTTHTHTLTFATLISFQQVYSIGNGNMCETIASDWECIALVRVLIVSVFAKRVERSQGCRIKATRRLTPRQWPWNKYTHTHTHTFTNTYSDVNV